MPPAAAMSPTVVRSNPRSTNKAMATRSNCRRVVAGRRPGGCSVPARVPGGSDGARATERSSGAPTPAPGWSALIFGIQCQYYDHTHGRCEGPAA